MNNRRKQMPPRRMKDMFLIFCEGETEETYIDMLRHYFRAPIRIVSSIFERLIRCVSCRLFMPRSV